MPQDIITDDARTKFAIFHPIVAAVVAHFPVVRDLFVVLNDPRGRQSFTDSRGQTHEFIGPIIEWRVGDRRHYYKPEMLWRDQTKNFFFVKQIRITCVSGERTHTRFWSALAKSIEESQS